MKVLPEDAGGHPRSESWTTVRCVHRVGVCVFTSCTNTQPEQLTGGGACAETHKHLVLVQWQKVSPEAYRGQQRTPGLFFSD